MATTSGAGWDPWANLDHAEPTFHEAARNTLHHAAQKGAAPGKTWLPSRPDDSQPTFGFDPARCALVGEPLPGDVRPALYVESFELGVVGAGDDDGVAPRQRIPLHGGTADGLLARFDRVLREVGEIRPLPSLEGPGYSLPPHPVATDGAAYQAPPASALRGLAAWIAAGFDAVAGAAEGRSRVTETRLWPHHFDIGALWLLADDEAGPLVGFGLSLGDAAYPYPYFYANPHPQPGSPGATPPPLPGPGFWHRDGWFGAVLRGEDLLAAPAMDRRGMACAHLAAGLDAGRMLLRAP